MSTDTKLKYEGFAVGQRVRAYDFERMKDRPDKYVEGTITQVNREGDEVLPFAHYIVKVEKDTLYPEDKPAGMRPQVFVPMQSRMDWDGRVILLEE